MKKLICLILIQFSFGVAHAADAGTDPNLASTDSNTTQGKHCVTGECHVSTVKLGAHTTATDDNGTNGTKPGTSH